MLQSRRFLPFSPGTPLASTGVALTARRMHRIALRQDDDDRTDPIEDGASATPRVDVLFVTADRDLREAGERALTGKGYQVRVAAHAGHAVLAGLTARVDVLVAELSSPDISGPALAERLRRHHPGLRVVFMANPGTPEGLAHVVVRPFTCDDLLARIALTSSAF